MQLISSHRIVRNKTIQENEASKSLSQAIHFLRGEQSGLMIPKIGGINNHHEKR